MNTLSPENHDGTKLITKACAWADQRKAAADAPSGRPKAREIGRLEVRGNELAEAVEKYRKAGPQP